MDEQRERKRAIAYHFFMFSLWQLLFIVPLYKIVIKINPAVFLFAIIPVSANTIANYKRTKYISYYIEKNSENSLKWQELMAGPKVKKIEIVGEYLLNSKMIFGKIKFSVNEESEYFKIRAPKLLKYLMNDYSILKYRSETQ